MPHYTYILQSEKTARYYCGQCNDITNRLKRHNAGEMRSTKSGVPWNLIGYIPFNTRPEAMQLEEKIKGRGIKRWLEENSHLLITAR